MHTRSISSNDSLAIFLQVFDQQKPETQEKIMDKIETKNGFLKILDIIYDRLK